MNNETVLKIRLLQEARRMINGRSVRLRRLGICNALHRAAGEMPFTGRSNPAEAEAYRLCSYIRRALQGQTYLEGWLMRNGHVAIAQNLEATKQARLDWIDWMIKCLREDNP